MCQHVMLLPRTIDFREGEDLSLCNSRIRWRFLHYSNIPDFSLVFYIPILARHKRRTCFIMEAFYITLQLLQHILTGETRHDFVPVK